MNQNRAVAILVSTLSLVAVSSAHAATITVTTESDAPGACSLREAVSAANSDAPAGGCPAGAGADTIALPEGRYELTIPGADEDSNASGDLDVASDLTIAGAGASRTTISAGRIDRVLTVMAGATASIDGVTITDGLSPGGAGAADVHAAPGAAATAGDGTAGEPGGGILNAGTLTVSHSVIAGNESGGGGRGGSADGGPGNPGRQGVGGKGGAGGDGGGLYSSGSLTLAGTRVSDNISGRGGNGGNGNGGNGSSAGGNASGAAGGSGFGGNAGPGGSGGGVEATGPLAISGSLVEDNSSGPGGDAGSSNGGYGGNGSGTGNGGPAGGSQAGAGGPGGHGGGVYAQDSSDITRSTIARNHAGRGGAGAPALAGDGGGGGGTNGNGGLGGTSAAGSGGNGGGGGGLLFTGKATLVNVTIDQNVTGRGGASGTIFPLGGAGGHGFGTGSGGNGGHSTGGSGGSGGVGGGILTGSALAATHVTISRNEAGAGAPGSFGIGGLGGAGGSNGGSHGSQGGTNNGSDGDAGGAGAIAAPGVDPATVTSSIFASNAPDTCTGAIADGGGNVGAASCAAASGDPRLGPLDDNGGEVPTRSLHSGSVAIDFVQPGPGCAAEDARGVTRPQGQGCDAGAYERALPGAATGEASALAPRSATVSGTLAANGRASYRFEYGTSAAYGSRTPAADATPEPSAALTGLEPSTTYHYRLVATNGDGTSAGEDRSFTTPAGPVDAVPPGKGTKPVLSKVSAKRKHGRTTFRYTLNKKARVTLTFKRAARVRGRFTVASKAGANRRKFSGKLGRRVLRPGRYRVTLVAKDAAGRRSAPKRVTVKVPAKR